MKPRRVILTIESHSREELKYQYEKIRAFMIADRQESNPDRDRAVPAGFLHPAPGAVKHIFSYNYLYHFDRSLAYWIESEYA